MKTVEASQIPTPAVVSMLNDAFENDEKTPTILLPFLPDADSGDIGKSTEDHIDGPTKEHTISVRRVGIADAPEHVKMDISRDSGFLVLQSVSYETTPRGIRLIMARLPTVRLDRTDGIRSLG